MMWGVFVRWISLLGLCHVIRGWPGGAPTSVCSSLTPNHGTYGQTSDSPFRVTLSKNTFNPGEVLTVTIEKTDDRLPDFRGFIIQAREEGSSVPAPGIFSDMKPAGKRMTCSGLADATASHSDGNDKRSVSMKWKAPTDYPAGKGAQLRLHATVVRTKMTYWTGITSEVITQADQVAESACVNTFLDCLGDDKSFVGENVSWETDSFCRVKPHIIQCVEAATAECKTEVTSHAKLDSGVDEDRVSVWKICSANSGCTQLPECLGSLEASLSEPRDWLAPETCNAYMRLFSCVTVPTSGCHGNWLGESDIEKVRAHLQGKCPGQEFPDVTSPGDDGDNKGKDDSTITGGPTDGNEAPTESPTTNSNNGGAGDDNSANRDSAIVTLVLAAIVWHIVM